jgi:hypothetical protein
MSWLTTKPPGYESNEHHLRDELQRIGGLLRSQLQRFRSARPEAQRERFWHLTDEFIDSLVGDVEHSPLALFEPADDVAEILKWVAGRRAEIDLRIRATRNLDLRLLRLRREFGLSGHEVDALLLALLPTLHSTYRHLLGILQHDPARIQTTVGFLTEVLAASSPEATVLLAALGPAGRLARGLVTGLAGADDGQLASRAVTVDERVSLFLFGGEGIDARIANLARWFDEPVALRELPVTIEVANRLDLLPNLRAAEPQYLPRLRLKFLGPDPELAIAAFAAVASGLKRRLLVVDIEAALGSGAPWPGAIDLALREARLGNGVPLFTGLEKLRDVPENAHRFEQLLARLREFPHPAAVELSSPAGDDIRVGGGWIPFQLAAPTVAMREKLWARALASEPNAVTNREMAAPALARAFQLTYGQFREAWRAAESLARQRNVFIASIETQDLYAACRQQSASRLVAFAQRIEPRRDLTLDRDIVLPAANKRLLGELRSRVRNHSRIQGEMGFGEHMRLGRGVTALFVGASGTGKTMAAEVLASEQQIDLYRIDLASLVSKWLGETEKNLNRVFADAERANCMLFFDECDSMFGRRGDVKEARDRWANLEVNFLLQRIEDYSGVVILATNLRDSIDEAFQRRIHVVVEFPMPDAASRQLIWQRLLPAGPSNGVPAADVAEIAQRFELSGGLIKNAVLDACFRAVEESQSKLTTRQLIASTAREYQKTARPVTRGEFGRFYDWALTDVIAPPVVPVVAVAATAAATGK